MFRADKISETVWLQYYIGRMWTMTHSNNFHSTISFNFRALSYCFQREATLFVEKAFKVVSHESFTVTLTFEMQKDWKDGAAEKTIETSASWKSVGEKTKWKNAKAISQKAKKKCWKPLWPK